MVPGPPQPHWTGPETERMQLRALTLADATAFYQLNSDLQVMRFTGEPLLASLEEAYQAIRDYPDFDTVGYGRWGCFFKPESRLVGFCGLQWLADLGEVDLGYRFLSAYWGRGLATEACQACLQFGFDGLQLSHIIALVLPENVASSRVLEKLGMYGDGQMRYQEQRVLRYRAHR